MIVVKKKSHIGFILINLFMKMFIVIGCFAFGFSNDGFNQKSIVIMKNIIFENRDIEFDITYCDNGVCQNRGSYTYEVDNKLKNNMEILAFKHLSKKENDKILLKTNGLRVVKKDKASSEYIPDIGLFSGDYLGYLEKIKKPINDFAMKNDVYNPIIYNVHFPKIRGSINITKIKANDNLYSYNSKMSISFDATIGVNALGGDGHNEDVVKINEYLVYDFDIIAKKDVWNFLFYDLMQNASSDVSYALANLELNSRTYENNYKNDDEMPVFRESAVDVDKREFMYRHFITLGVGAIPFELSLGRDYKMPDDYSHYFKSISFGYNWYMADLYNVSANININIGKKDFLIMDQTYAFKNPLLLSLSAGLSKKIYFNSDIYISPLISGSITKVSSSELKGFESDAFVQNSNILIGGEIGFSGDDYEVAFWVHKLLKNSSKVMGKDKVYMATVSDGVSFGLEYRHEL